MSDSVLIVENDPALRRELISVFAAPAFEVSGASNYFDVLGEIDESKPDLAVINEALPLVDGWEVCFHLHWTFGIPVILMSANYNRNVWADLLLTGADFYLQLPCNHLELVARVRAIIRRYKNSGLKLRN